MNANEVIANRGLELLGHGRGEYRYLHPVEDVNMSQSTNDVHPTAVKVALHFAIGPPRRGYAGAAPCLRRQGAGVHRRSEDGAHAAPGRRADDARQEFTTYAVIARGDEERLREAALLITEINLGATAIGTGINAHPNYAALVVPAARRAHPHPPRDGFEPRRGDADAGAFVQLSGRAETDRGESSPRSATTAAAVLGSARRPWRDQPAAGAGGIVHHARQGQSGHSGGREPDRVRGHRQRRDRELRRGSGQLQLNAFEPVIAHSLFKSLMHLQNGCDTLREPASSASPRTGSAWRRPSGSRSSRDRAQSLYRLLRGEASAREALATGRAVYDLVLEKKLLSKEQLDEILRPENLTRPGRPVPPEPSRTRKS